MASSCMGCLLGSLFILVALLQGAAAQRMHVVGDTLGWTVPPSNFSYQTWAANQTFMVGDYLMFNFTHGEHDVGEFLKADYESCTVNVMNTINGLIESSEILITIETAGDHYYTCTYGDNCRRNQKLTIIAFGTPISSPPPPPSSASSLTVAGFSLLLLLPSTIIAFFY